MADKAFVRKRTTEVSLREGTRVRLRPIVPEDKALLAAGFERLSPESRFRRFMAPIAELSAEQLVSLTELDYVNHFAWIAISLNEPGMPGVGVSRYVRRPEEPEVAEAAVTVVDEYQGRGLGTLLLEALGAVALENEVYRFRGYVLEGNRPMLDLIEALGGSVGHDSPGLARVEIDLPRHAEGLRGSPLYEVLRAVAKGDGPVFVPPDTLSQKGTAS
jgi:GNAT superfamily N-acetyltransferase